MLLDFDNHFSVYQCFLTQAIWNPHLILLFWYRYRYAEPVSSLMVYAQHQLVARLTANGGRLPPQSHFEEAIRANGGRPITAFDYLRLQLRIHLDKSETIPKLEPGAQIDPRGHMRYTCKSLIWSLSWTVDRWTKYDSLNDQNAIHWSHIATYFPDRDLSLQIFMLFVVTYWGIFLLCS